MMLLLVVVLVCIVACLLASYLREKQCPTVLMMTMLLLERRCGPCCSNAGLRRRSDLDLSRSPQKEVAHKDPRVTKGFEV